MKRTPIPSTTSDLAKEFLGAPGKQRPARPAGRPDFPRPIHALLDSDGYLRWTWYKLETGGRDQPPEFQKPRNGLCFEFARLAHASDEDIRRFAEKWGPLGIELRQEEHVNDWRRHAALAQALLSFAADRATGGRGSEEAWGTIRAWSPAGDTSDLRPTLRERTAIAASAINAWFVAARGHRIMAVVKGQFQIQPAASNLFGTLAAQVAHAMSRADERVQCSGCKTAFHPKTPISHGSRQYCSRCRRAKVPQRDASRDWRRRNRKQGTA
jgi:hypothetical protein